MVRLQLLAFFFWFLIIFVVVIAFAFAFQAVTHSACHYTIAGVWTALRAAITLFFPLINNVLWWRIFLSHNHLQQLTPK